MRGRTTGNMLHLANGKTVRFDFSIEEAIDVGGVSIVVLAQPADRDISENVYAVDPDGRLMWRIAPRDFPEGPDYYVGASEAGGAARLIHFSGFVLDVDPGTGHVLAQKFVK